MRFRPVAGEPLVNGSLVARLHDVLLDRPARQGVDTVHLEATPCSGRLAGAPSTSGRLGRRCCVCANLTADAPHLASCWLPLGEPLDRHLDSGDCGELDMARPEDWPCAIIGKRTTD